jgi:hypothetical protein
MSRSVTMPRGFPSLSTTTNELTLVSLILFAAPRTEDASSIQALSSSYRLR